MPDERDHRLDRLRPVLADARQRNLRLAALGGAAVQILCPSARGDGPWSRSIADLDLASVSADRSSIEALLVGHDFQPEERFNMMNGSFRLRFLDADGSHVDVFLNAMELCHVIDWTKRLRSCMDTLPLSELLLTKLQIVHLEPKDIGDLAALLTDQWSAIDTSSTQLRKVVGSDWGLWRTSLTNLERLMLHGDATVRARATQLREIWLAGPFSLKWRARALIGTRVRWYQEPEET